MPATIFDNQPLNERIGRLAEAQPIRMNKSSMIESLCHEACTAFEVTGEPEAWRRLQPVSNGTEAIADRGSNGSVNHQPTPAIRGDSDMSGAQTPREASKS